MDISSLGDDELLSATQEAAFALKRSSAALIAHLAELDRRDLTIRRGYGSLYEYAVNRLRLSEGAAYRHIRAARSTRLRPELLVLLRGGELSVDALVLLHPCLKDPDAPAVIRQAIGLRSWQLQALLAARGLEPLKRDVIRPMGRPSPPRTESAGSALPLRSDPAPCPIRDPSPPQAAARAIPPTSATPVRFAFTADGDFLDMVRRARQLLRHKYPDGRLEGVFRDALKALLHKKDPFFRRGGTYPRFSQRD